MLQAAWDGFDRGGQHPAGPAPPQDFPSWLPDFFEVILAAANSELRWCASVLPDLHPRLVLHLLAALFTKISKSFRSRLMSACAQGMQDLTSDILWVRGTTLTQGLRPSSGAAPAVSSVHQDHHELQAALDLCLCAQVQPAQT